MAKIFYYNSATNKMQVYHRGENEPMPGNKKNSLLVREFRGSSKSAVLWTTAQAMSAWNETRAAYGQPIYVGYAFKRIWEGGHGNTSQHYAGVSFDVGQNLNNAGRARLRKVASSLGVWGYVEPASLTPTWVHFDRRYGTPACGGSSGYPKVQMGSISTYVLILQDALNALGYNAGHLDGIFGHTTKKAVLAFQKKQGLTADGIVGCTTWKLLAKKAVGIGRTDTVKD